MSAPVAGRRDDSGKEDCEYRKKRKREAQAERRRAAAGVLFVAVGLTVFFAQPEHGATVALFLVGFGCLMINAKLALSVINRHHDEP